MLPRWRPIEEIVELIPKPESSPWDDTRSGATVKQTKEPDRILKEGTTPAVASVNCISSASKIRSDATATFQLPPIAQKEEAS
jgi:hypothetical protein